MTHISKARLDEMMWLATQLLPAENDETLRDRALELLDLALPLIEAVAELQREQQQLTEKLRGVEDANESLHMQNDVLRAQLLSHRVRPLA